MKQFLKKYPKLLTTIYYIALIFFVFISLNWQKQEKANIINYIILISLLFLYPLFYYLVYDKCKKFKTTDYVSKEYYLMQIHTHNQLYTADFLKPIFPIVSVIIGVIVLLMLCVPFEWLIDIFEYFYANTIGSGSEIELLTVVIAMLALMTTFFPIMTSYLNRKCLFFDVYKLPQVKAFNCQILVSLIISIVFFIALPFFKNTDIGKAFLGGLELIWLCSCIINGGLYFFVFLLPIEVERKVVKKIDKLYNTRINYLTPSKKWYKGSALEEFIYLLERYRKHSKCIDISKIEEIKFGSVYEGADSFSLSIKKFRIILLCFLGFMFPLFFNVYKMISHLNIGIKVYYCLIMLAALSPISILLYNKEIIRENSAYINDLVFCSSWGYYIHLKGENGCIYVTSFDPFIPNKYHKYIRNLKKIVCFYNLASDMHYEDTENFGIYGLDCLLAYVTDMYYRNENICNMLAPIIICACLQNDKDPAYNNNKVNDFFKNIQIPQCPTQTIMCLCIEMIRELHGNDKTFNENHYKKIISEIFS